MKEWAVRYKGGKCELCPYARSVRAFEFHHVDPTLKDFNIADRLACSREALAAELDKCIMVCANCHREIHDGWHPRFWVDPDDTASDDFFEADEGEL